MSDESLRELLRQASACERRGQRVRLADEESRLLIERGWIMNRGHGWKLSPSGRDEVKRLERLE